jgi:PKD domain
MKRIVGWLIAMSARLLALAAFALAALTLAGIAPSASAVTVKGKLLYGGGPVLHSSAPYLVFWTPSGENVPASSQALMVRFFADVAADSGKSSNVFGVLRQYYDRFGFADYRQTFNPARQVIVDTQPYPPRDAGQCPDVSSTQPTCIGDTQIRSELQRLIAADGLPNAGKPNPELSPNAPIYFVVLPADVTVCNLFGTKCTDRNIVAYHGSFTDPRGNDVLYSPIATDPQRPPPPHFTGLCSLGGTSLAQEPNGDPADCVINRLSHELSETVTDPVSPSGWSTALGQLETGDECGVYGPFDPANGFNPNAYAPTLGGSASAGTLYDQLINGHPYYFQSEWSNGARTCAERPSTRRLVPRFTAPGPKVAAITLSFNPAASTNTNTLSSATWNFGDGSMPAFFSGKGALTSAKHRYRKAGRYTVTLTLVDNRGNLQSTTRRVTVHARRR